MFTRIVIGGLAGTGKSTLARRLADHYGVQRFSAGAAMRQLAFDRGIDLVELEREAEADTDVDAEVTERVFSFARDHMGWVIEGWFVWALVGEEATKIQLICSDPVRFSRVATRDQLSLRQAQLETEGREATLAQRFGRQGGIPDWNNPRYYDHVIDTTDLSEEFVFRAALECLPDLPVLSARAGFP